jgi:hypothetical protein
LGSTPLALALCLAMRRQLWADPRGENALALEVELLAPDAKAAAALWRQAWPELGDDERWQLLPKTSAPGFVVDEQLKARLWDCRAVYVALEPGAEAVDTAIDLAQRFDFPTVVWTDERHTPPSAVQLALEPLTVLDVWQLGFGELLTDYSTSERLARAAHEWYLDTIRREPGRTGTFQEWDDLDEFRKESNRQQTAGLRAAFESRGYSVERVRSAQSAPEIPNETLVVLAVGEHKRWQAWMELNGWSGGGETDRANRIHADIKPWDALEPKAQEKDKDAVERFPRLLASIGYALVRPGADRADG